MKDFAQKFLDQLNDFDKLLTIEVGSSSLITIELDKPTYYKICLSLLCYFESILVPQSKAILTDSIELGRLSIRTTSHKFFIVRKDVQ